MVTFLLVLIAIGVLNLSKEGRNLMDWFLKLGIFGAIAWILLLILIGIIWGIQEFGEAILGWGIIIIGYQAWKHFKNKKIPAEK